MRRARHLERHRQPHAHHDARRVPRRRRALRDGVRVRGRRRHRGRLDRPAARRADQGDQGRRLDAAALGHRDQPARAGRARRGGQRGRRCGRAARDADRRARHHGAEGRRRRRRHVGARSRLLPPARRARGPGVLRRAQPDLHGRQVRRRTRERPGRPAGPGHAGPRGHPHAEPVGAAAHPGARARPSRPGAGGRIPVDRSRAGHPSSGRASQRRPRSARADPGGQRARVGLTAHRSPVGPRHAVAAHRRHVAHEDRRQRARGRPGERPGRGRERVRPAERGRRGARGVAAPGRGWPARGSRCG